MALIVQKFGGSSLADMELIRRAAARVVKARQAGDQVVVVVSAMQGETDRLAGIASSMLAHASARELDVLLSTGEQQSASLFCLALQGLGCSARSVLGSQVPIVTDDRHQSADILHIETQLVNKLLQGSVVPVITGFQGVTADGAITTLGRGGSDTTAVALAGALGAHRCQIFTDVDGVYTADPNVVPKARLIESISFSEMQELSRLGAGVLHPRAVKSACRHLVPVEVLSSFTDNAGTYVTNQVEDMPLPHVSGIALDHDQVRMTLRFSAADAHVVEQLRQRIESSALSVDMLISHPSLTSGGSYHFTVHRCDQYAISKLCTELLLAFPEVVFDVDDEVAKLSLVGVSMSLHAGISHQMLRVLADEGVAVQLITSSAFSVSLLIGEKYLELAARTLHDIFVVGECQVSGAVI